MRRSILLAVIGLSLAGASAPVSANAEVSAREMRGSAASEQGASASASASVVPPKADAVPGVGTTEIVGQITGRASPNDTAARWNIHGTDLGHMFLHRGDLYMVFGDTFGPTKVWGREDWRSNTMARIADPDPRMGLAIESMITGRDGTAKELLPSRKIDGAEMTVIPTFGLSIDDRMYLHYMSVNHWADPGVWRVNHSGIAFSDDDGQTWATPAAAVWPPDTGFEQVAFVRDGATVYSFGIPEGRFGDVKLRRSARDRVLDPHAYEYWVGEGWAADMTAAVPVVPGPAGELSVAWSAHHGLWLMMYLDPARRAVVLRTAPQLVGPWAAPQPVASARDFPGLYAPYIVPGYEIGADIYYTLSRWDPYNVYLMRTTFDAPAVASAGGPADEQDRGDALPASGGDAAANPAAPGGVPTTIE